MTTPEGEVGPIGEVVDDAFGDLAGLAGVVGSAAAAVGAVGVVEVDADVVAFGVRRGVGDEFAVVELVVGERDEVLVPGAVVPAQAEVAERATGLGEFEDGLEVLDVGVLVVAVVLGALEERRRAATACRRPRGSEPCLGRCS